MTLNNTQKFIFYKLARCCIKYQKPIGSKFLAKKLSYKLSAPSLRIYFRKIAKKGYLEKKSFFSGNSPTDKGWYYYLKNFPLKPEVKISKFEERKIDEKLEYLSFLTKNIIIFCDQKIKIRGLNNAFYIKEKEIVEDLFFLLENFDKIIRILNNNLNILIGEKIEESISKKISLIAYKNKNKIIGILGKKINYYHTNLVFIKNLIKNLKE